MIQPFVTTQFCRSPGLVWPRPAGLVLTGTEPITFSMWGKHDRIIRVDDQPGLHITYKGAPAFAYPWADQDVAVFGEFEGLFVVTLGDGKKEAVPNGFKLPIRIEEAI